MSTTPSPAAPTTSTVDLPARTLSVLDAPVPLVHAVAHADERGYFTGVVAVPTEEMMRLSEHGDYDAFYDNLLNRLVVSCDAYSMAYQIVGVSEDGQTLYVEASTSIADLAAYDPDWLVEEGATREQVDRLLGR